MDTRATIISIIVSALLSATGSWAFVNDFDRLKPTLFEELKSRQCLPTNFNFSITKSVEQECRAKITAGGLPEECAGAPRLALFYNCIANNGRGLLTAMPLNATYMDFYSPMKSIMAKYSDDKDWLAKTKQFTEDCSMANWVWSKPLNTRQQLGVHNYLCVHMALIQDCDRLQEKNGTLDEFGKLRRVRLLTGDYRYSLNTMKNAMKPFTNRTLEECSQGLYTGNDVNQKYEAQISRILCLMKDFIDHSGSNDIMQTHQLREKMLKMYPIYRERPEDIKAMTSRLYRCGKKDGVEPTKFAKCWATHGLFLLPSQESSEVASQFPETCVTSIGA